MLHRAEQQHRCDQPEELHECDAQPDGPHHIELPVEPALQRVGASLVPPQCRILRATAVDAQNAVSRALRDQLTLVVQLAAAGVGYPALATPRLDIVPVLVRRDAAALELWMAEKRLAFIVIDWLVKFL